jgi:hypothetical protein
MGKLMHHHSLDPVMGLQGHRLAGKQCDKEHRGKDNYAEIFQFHRAVVSVQQNCGIFAASISPVTRSTRPGAAGSWNFLFLAGRPGLRVCYRHDALSIPISARHRKFLLIDYICRIYLNIFKRKETETGDIRGHDLQSNCCWCNIFAAGRMRKEN